MTDIALRLGCVLFAAALLAFAVPMSGAGAGAGDEATPQNAEAGMTVALLPTAGM